MRARGWDDAAWDDAAARLTERGWLDGDELSAEGLAMVAAIEADTDRLALRPVAGARRRRLRPAGRAADADPPRGRRGGGLAGRQPDRRPGARLSGHVTRARLGRARSRKASCAPSASTVRNRSIASQTSTNRV